jgi:hypothetical protein
MPNKFYDLIREEFLEPAGLISKEKTLWCFVKHSWWTEQIVWDAWELLYQGWSICGWEDYVWDSIGNISDIERYEEIEILGHPYDLREVMRWFYLKRDYYFFNGNGNISEIDVYEGGECLLLNINLSKPLRDQDLEPLYNLMKSLS